MPAQMSWCLPRASQKTKHITTPNVQEISVRCGLSVHLSHLSVFLFCTNRIKSLSSEMILLVPVCAVLSRFSRVRLFATLWTVAHQAPLTMRFSRQEYWSEQSCSPPGGLPDPGTEPKSLTSPALSGGLFTPSTTWDAQWPYQAQAFKIKKTVNAKAGFLYFDGVYILPATSLAAFTISFNRKAKPSSSSKSTHTEVT